VLEHTGIAPALIYSDHLTLAIMKKVVLNHPSAHGKVTKQKQNSGRFYQWPALCLMVFLALLANRTKAQWIQQGPGPSKNGQVEGITDREIVGAVNCVTPHPTNANVLYVGGVNGGVWRTDNATAARPVWGFISPEFASQSIGALEFDPTDATNLTLVAANGRTSSFNSIGSGNRGIYRTTTGTGPWTNIDVGGTFANRDITGIAARGATIVLSSTSGGIWRTTNTGGVWTQLSTVAASGLPAGGSFDLVGDPLDNTILYAHAGTGANAGIYKSTNTGESWTRVSNAAMNTDIAAAGNVELAVGRSNNVYAAIVQGGRLSDVYRSGDGGGAGGWTSLDIPTTTETGTVFGIHVGGQGNNHLSLAADPVNANVVYIGGDRQPWASEPNTLGTFFPNASGANDFSGRLFRINASLAPGSQFAAITHVGTAGNSAPHADSRDMDFDANGDMIEGDDGGVYKQSSPADATGNWTSLVGNLNVTEIHSIDWDANANIIISGAQDNGIPQQEFPGNSRWSSVSTGDGGDVSVDDISSAITSVRYSSAQNLSNFRRRVYTPGNTFVSQTFPALTDIATGMPIANGFSFVTPVKLNSQNGARMLIAANGALFESADGGSTASNIGAFTVNNFGQDALAYGAVGNANIIYAGVGATVRIRTAAAPAAFTTSATYTGGQVQGIAMDPDDAQSAYVIDNTRVFETSNSGGAWTERTGNLGTFNPGTLRSIAYIPTSTDDILAVGTDLGVFIAPGPAFNVWARLGTNFPNVGVYDLEYDRKDSLLVAGTMGRGAWTISFAERGTVDVALVLDYSGSMLSPACPTCAPKVDVLKDAVEIFMRLWKELAVANDRIGAVYFRTNVNQYEEGGTMLLPVIDKTDAVINDVRAQTASNLTALGGGLQSAINQLTTVARPRNIILFTDGMQNVNPGVVYPSLNIQNGVYSSNSNISATTPATVLNPALGIKINTIGVGATSAFESQLADIATGTNGITKITTAPDEALRRFFVEELVDVLRNYSPQLVDYRKGATAAGTATASFSPAVATENFSINRTPKKVILKVSYQRGDDMSISIYKGSTDVTRLASIVNGSFYKIFTFPFARLALFQGPAYDGPWQVRMNSGKKPMNYEIAAIADEASLKYNLSLGNGPHKTGQPIRIKAQTLVDGMPVTDDVSITATVERPVQGMGTLLSKAAMPSAAGTVFEPNLSLGAQKFALLTKGNQAFVNSLRPSASNMPLAVTDDHAFQGDFTNTTVPGTYTVTYTIKGKHPYTGDFERVEQRAVVLRFTDFNLNASAVRVTRNRAKEGTLYTWSFTPKDKYGNYLGPDYGSLLQVASPDGSIQNVKDLGNGSYEIQILATGSNRPRLRLGLYDENWFDGMIPNASGGKRFSLSLHGGAAIPTGNFANAYTASVFGKLDVEYRLPSGFSLQATGGLYHFNKGLNVGFGCLQVKKYWPINGNSNFFAEAGPGLFFFPAKQYAGVDAGLGVDFKLGSKHRLSLGANYIGLVNHPLNYKWLAAGLGLHIGF
jgi:von Willebrand factor type A domain